ncbi:MAG: class I SAM-dependent methyltransferase [Candidatus Bathyarchaeota archaeon]|nr:class I SAM-dependent methyltransferase [Candidatus Bathyarchaeota archaeon]
MKDKNCVDDVEVKKANVRHHDVEAEIFEHAHPEGSSIYERSKVLKSIAFIAENSDVRDLCVDVGCGTGFVTSFELPLYTTLVAMDISRRMLEVAWKRHGHFKSLNLVRCDAEHLPLKSEIADLVSVSSVLHHLPKPFNSMTEISRVLKEGGFLYVTREPNFQRLRRFFDFFDHMIVQKFVKVLRRLPLFRSELYREPNVVVDGLDYAKVDVHYSTGFHVGQLAEFLRYRSFKPIFAYSYHWIYPDSDRGLLQQLLTKSNFVIEKIPLSRKFGRYVSVIARKLEKQM